jgi:hypothetical protein
MGLKPGAFQLWVNFIQRAEPHFASLRVSREIGLAPTPGCQIGFTGTTLYQVISWRWWLQNNAKRGTPGCQIGFTWTIHRLSSVGVCACKIT